MYILHKDDISVYSDKWAIALVTGEDYQIEYRLKRAADGVYHVTLPLSSVQISSKSSNHQIAQSHR